MRHCLILFLLLVACGGGGGGSQPPPIPIEDFKAWVEFEKPYPDVDKQSGDSNLCWAAAAANALAWSGWAADEHDVFNVLKTEFGNVLGFSDSGIKFYFTEYLSEDYGPHLSIGSLRYMSTITDSLIDGSAVIISLYNGERRHDLSVYGYQVYEDMNKLYVADADDGSQRVFLITFDKIDTKWVAHYPYSGWVIIGVTILTSLD